MTTQSYKTLVLDLLRQGHHDEEVFLHGLSETERAATGTPELWSAKDHVAHWTFWHQNLLTRLNAVLQQQEVPSRESDDDDQINARVFEEHRFDSLPALHAESERVYAELITLIEQLSEDDLTDTSRFTAITEDRPLYTAFLGSLYEHDQEHLVQYYADRHDLQRAIQMREKCADRVMHTELPDWVKGSFLYNLACFYALHNSVEKAAALLPKALTLAPDLTEWSKSDPDLAALRAHSASNR